jgi:hypothetical protein
MANKVFQKAVLNHARVTIITPDLMPTGAAQRDRRIAATVDKQQ